MTQIHKCLIGLILVTMIISSCNTNRSLTTNISPTDELYELMQGSFDSSEQALLDSSYYDITLHMYPIWADATDGKWLYVEQSVSSMQDKPYRQRLYRVVPGEAGTVASYVYTINDDSLYIGKWAEPAFFADKGRDIVQIREGCEVLMLKGTDGTFIGSTVSQNCKSTLRGASYATSQVVIEDGLVTSWDQGFNDAGEQVWGAEKGPYIFKAKKK